MASWPQAPLSSVLTQVHRPVSVTGLAEVPFAGVRWYAEGVYARDVKSAVTVKTKVLNRLHSDDITYNRMWATKAAFGVVPSAVDGCLVTTDFPIFVAEDHSLPAFLALIFQTRVFQSEASILAVGTTERRRLKEANFLSITVPLPSRAVQRRIVDLIGALDAQIEFLDQELAAATEMLVVGCRTLTSPSTCESIVTLAEECDILDTLREPVNGTERTQRRGTVPYYGANGQVGFIDEAVFDEPLTLVPEDQHAGFFSLFLRKRMAYSIEGPAWVNNHAHVLRAKTTSRDWVYYSLRHRDLLEFVTDATRSKLTRKNLERISLGIPNDWQQRAGHLRGIEDTCSALAAERENLNAVRQGLVERLLARLIEIPESYDEAVAEEA